MAVHIASPTGLLDFHRQMISDLHATPGIPNPDLSTGDGLLVTARGLGLQRILSTLIQIHTDPHTLVLLINTPVHEALRLWRDVRAAGERLGVLDGTSGDRVRPELFRIVNNETPARTRADMYLAGGVLSISSQILVLDMLNKVVPVHLVTGILVNHAHRVRDVSMEAFILRLFRADNKIGFIQAFSEDPEALASSGGGSGGSIMSLERTMRVLFLRSVYLWPRFQVAVKESLDSGGRVALVELRVPMTRRMRDIQAAIMDCLHECLLEVKRSNPNVETEDLKLENALFQSFDVMVRMQLDPIWHRVGSKTKQLVKDLRVLRQLLSYLVTYDAVTFYSFLETIMAANAAASSSVFRQGFIESPWLLLDAAHTVFSMGKERAYRKVPTAAAAGSAQPSDPSSSSSSSSSLPPPPPQSSTTGHDHGLDGIPPNIDPVLEEQPKWRAVVEVMREILDERNAASSASGASSASNTGNILIMANGDRMCRQLGEILAGITHSADWPYFNQRDIANHSTGEGVRGRPRFVGPGSERLMRRTLYNYFRWKGGMVGVTRMGRPDTTAAGTPGTGNAATLDRSCRVLTQPSVGSTGSASGGGYGSGYGSGYGGYPGYGGSASQPAGAGRGNQPPSKRRRVRGASASAAASGLPSASPAGGRAYRSLDSSGALAPAAFEDEAEQVARFLRMDDEDDAPDDNTDGEAATTAADSEAFIHIKSYAHTAASTATSTASVLANKPACSQTHTQTAADGLAPSNAVPGSETATADETLLQGEDDTAVLERLCPQWIIMYDPDVAFVRRVEVFKALNPHLHIKVYFLVYDNSVEEQRYLTSIRREKEAFERLINQKASMVIPIDQDGRVAVDPEELFWRNADTRRAGGQRAVSAVQPVVVVDTREFRSSLPSLVHAKGIALKPCTLEVGDYVLSPRLCVERKSVSDLISSLKSGRLYNQCEAMSLHYDVPILLIEFDSGRSFSLVASSADGTGLADGISATDITSRISLLCLTFTKLRVIWSSGAAATAEIFLDLKANENQPDVEQAAAVGVESRTSIDSAFNITPSDMLLALPGVTTKNYRKIMARVRDMRSLTEMPLVALEDLIGAEAGRQLHEFLHATVMSSAQKQAQTRRTGNGPAGAFGRGSGWRGGRGGGRGTRGNNGGRGR
ncbi:hypothetical protein BC831DRAFT_462186 [Entophlyctis helioformis]|nr:hypothetical protein BC831DRAFT_462186 [Entophlyctis helioformis]